MPRQTKPKREWPADNVERRPIERLLPYARNARTHSDEQVAQLAGLIREYGWTMPVLVDASGTLIAGHGRVLAARQLGITTIPTMVVTDWSEAKQRAYRLADNQVPQGGGWDKAMLRVELSDLRIKGVDLEGLGFSPIALADLLPEDDLLDLHEDHQQSAGSPKLKWGDVVIPLNDAEVAALNAAYERHFTEHGVAFGFVGRLLRHV